MVLELCMGGMAIAAACALLTLHPGQSTLESPPQAEHGDEAVLTLHPGQPTLESPSQAEHGDGSPLAYLSPVDAEVVDPFRPPAHIGAPGNRGLEYAPEPGLPVQASAEGQVVFAGSVARNRFVTVLHRDGLRTSYGYLGWIAVQKGDWVERGRLLGTTSDRFFFSVRAGGAYLDPALVLTAGRVRLVPHKMPDNRSRLPAYGQLE